VEKNCGLETERERAGERKHVSLINRQREKAREREEKEKGCCISRESEKQQHNYQSWNGELISLQNTTPFFSLLILALPHAVLELQEPPLFISMEIMWAK